MDSMDFKETKIKIYVGLAGDITMSILSDITMSILSFETNCSKLAALLVQRWVQMTLLFLHDFS